MTTIIKIRYKTLMNASIAIRSSTLGVHVAITDPDGDCIEEELKRKELKKLIKALKKEYKRIDV